MTALLRLRHLALAEGDIGPLAIRNGHRQGAGLLVHQRAPGEQLVSGAPGVGLRPYCEPERADLNIVLSAVASLRFLQHVLVGGRH